MSNLNRKNSLWLGPEQRKKLLEIYAAWQDRNQFAAAKYIAGCGILINAFMVGFDKLLIPESNPYFDYRIVSILALCANFYLAGIFSRVVRPKMRKAAGSFTLLFTSVAFWVAYVKFVFFMQPYNEFAYYIGLLLVAIFGTVMLYRFWREQYFFNILGIVSMLAILFIPEHGGKAGSDKAYIAIVALLVSAQMAIYFRRQFCGGLFERYNLMRTMVPQQVAYHLVTSDGMADKDAIFSASHRFSVCLSSDWRNFQKLCKERTPSEISKLIETYYDLVDDILSRFCPEGDYFSNWTADELFITFYSPDENRQKVVDTVLKFAHCLATEGFKNIEEKWGIGTINYDIGISSGLGLVGLLGPRFMKKATILGEIAGTSKRLQQEAKTQRESREFYFPTIVVDKATLKSASADSTSLYGEFRRIQTTTKDIENTDCWLWNAELSARKLRPRRTLKKAS